MADNRGRCSGCRKHRGQRDLRPLDGYKTRDGQPARLCRICYQLWCFRPNKPQPPGRRERVEVAQAGYEQVMRGREINYTDVLFDEHHNENV